MCNLREKNHSVINLDMNYLYVSLPWRFTVIVVLKIIKVARAGMRIRSWEIQLLIVSKTEVVSHPLLITDLTLRSLLNLSSLASSKKERLAHQCVTTSGQEE